MVIIFRCYIYNKSSRCEESQGSFSYMQLVTPSEVAMAVKIEIKICISVFQDSRFIVINV